MTMEMTIVLVIMLAAFAAMLWERLSVDLVGMLTMGALLAAGILTPEEAFQVFSNSAAITVASLFVVSAALERTGVIDELGLLLNRYIGQDERGILIITLPLIALISAFVNNTPVVLVFMPLVMSFAAKRGIRPSKLLIPVSFASILGGCCTLIGTSTNILVSSTAESEGVPPLEMFSLSPIGLILTGVGLVYLLTAGLKRLPNRETLLSILSETDTRQYLTEAVIVHDSPLIGKRLSETPLKSLPSARILEVIRRGEIVPHRSADFTLQSGDRLRLSTVLSSVMEINQLKGIKISGKTEDLGIEFVGTMEAAIVECVVAPLSNLVEKTIKQQDLRRRFGVIVLAVHRRGVNLRENFANVKLQYGDILLIESTESALRRLQETRDLIVLGGKVPAVKRRGKRAIAVAALASVVALGAFSPLPIAAAAVFGALLVVATGCLQTEEAYHAINWPILFMIFGLLSLGVALEKTQVIHAFAESMVRMLGAFGPKTILSCIVLLCSFLTLFLSNNVVAVILTPVAVEVAGQLHVNTTPFLIGVAVGASACFATPIGYQTNLLVYGAGGYRFRDFLRIGIPLNILVWALGSLLIPLLYPF